MLVNYRFRRFCLDKYVSRRPKLFVVGCGRLVCYLTVFGVVEVAIGNIRTKRGKSTVCIISTELLRETVHNIHMKM